MPATNFTPIQLYRTNTASTTAPSAGNLNAGELAINYNDGGMILFAKNNSGTVIKLMNNPANLLYPTADGSAGQSIRTDGSGTLSFGTLGVAGGGTGLTTTTAYSVVFTGTTATGNFQASAGPGTAGQVLTSNGAGALPTFQTSSGISTGKAIAMAMIFGF
jgi:hypothetical protein